MIHWRKESGLPGLIPSACSFYGANLRNFIVITKKD